MTGTSVTLSLLLPVALGADDGDGDGVGGGVRSSSASEAIVFSSLKPAMNVLLIFLSRYHIWTRRQRLRSFGQQTS